MDKRDSIFDTVISYFKSGKRAKLLLVIALVGVVLLVFFSFSGRDTKEVAEYDSLEEHLEEICSSVSGVGKCRVILYYAEAEKKYGTTAEPRVESIVVVCKGAANPKVRQELTSMLTALYGIGANRVYISLLK